MIVVETESASFTSEASEMLGPTKAVATFADIVICACYHYCRIIRRSAREDTNTCGRRDESGDGKQSLYGEPLSD